MYLEISRQICVSTGELTGSMVIFHLFSSEHYEVLLGQPNQAATGIPQNLSQIPTQKRMGNRVWNRAVCYLTPRHFIISALQCLHLTLHFVINLLMHFFQRWCQATCRWCWPAPSAQYATFDTTTTSPAGTAAPAATRGSRRDCKIAFHFKLMQEGAIRPNNSRQLEGNALMTCGRGYN